MKLTKLLRDHREKILGLWVKRVVETYPPETAKFLLKQKDPFANPVGSQLVSGTADLFDAIVDGADDAGLAKALDGPIRLRAVQSFSPSEALSFVLLARQTVREVLADELGDGRCDKDLAVFDGRVERALLVAFDVYMGCREKMYSLRAQQAQDATWKLLERAKMTPGFPEPDDDKADPGD